MHEESQARPLPRGKGASVDLGIPSWVDGLRGALNRYNCGTLRISHGENLPRWTCKGAVYHVVIRQNDSIPETKRLQWIEERDLLLRRTLPGQKPLTPDEHERIKFLHSERIARCLDDGHGSCVLRNAVAASVVIQTLEFHEGVRYRMHAWCVMPNHVHVIMEPIEPWSLSTILHTWKSYTTHRVNKLLGRMGQLWQTDAYTHIIRSDGELLCQVRYVLSNPGSNQRIPRWVRPPP